MVIKNLEGIEFQDLLDCFNKSFSDYVVKFEADYDYLWKRWKVADVDYSMSFGAFIDQNLVGFVISGVGNWQGVPAIYNAGTGVIPEFRGRKIIGKIYEVMLPVFKEMGIKRSVLEVITTNTKAIRVYQKAGFRITEELVCLAGKWAFKGKEEKIYDVHNSDHWITDHFQSQQALIPAWENSFRALSNRASNYHAFYIQDDSGKKGMAIANVKEGYIAQFLLRDTSDIEVAGQIIRTIARENPSIKINNISSQHSGFVDLCKSHGLKETIRQYEMELDLQ